MGPTVLPAAKRKWQGAEKTGPTVPHGHQGLLLRSAHRRTTLDTRPNLHRYGTNCWLLLLLLLLLLRRRRPLPLPLLLLLLLLPPLLRLLLLLLLPLPLRLLRLRMLLRLLLLLLPLSAAGIRS
jgi:hypothetical protein